MRLGLVNKYKCSGGDNGANYDTQNWPTRMITIAIRTAIPYHKFDIFRIFAELINEGEMSNAICVYIY